MSLEHHLGVQRLCLILALIAGSAPASLWAKPSCGSGGPTGEGSGSAGAGTYRYRVPASYSPNTAIPLLLALHGDEGTPDYIYSAFRGLQDSSAGAFILVTPKAPFGGGSWYQATSQHTDFINQVIDSQLKGYNIDQDRIWITGWSGGATFLGYYAIKRQDILAAVVYHMGGGGGGSYSPPSGSCLIPGRFVIGSADFLYSLAQSQYNTMKTKGHDVVWVELPGVGHSFQQSTLPGTWSWLQGKTLCGKTIPGTCGPPPPPDLGAPPPHDTGVGPVADGAPPMPATDGGAPSQGDIITLQHPQKRPLDGGCTCSAGGSDLGRIPSTLAVLGLLALVRRRRRQL